MAEFDSKLDEVRKTSYAYVADSMTGERDEAHAWLAFAQGQMETAIKMVTVVADKQDREGKGEVELPAREMLADMLLLGGRPAEALTQYRLCLRTDPNRLNAFNRCKACGNVSGTIMPIVNGKWALQKSCLSERLPTKWAILSRVEGTDRSSFPRRQSFGTTKG